jgi:hypothetical protein
VEAGATEIGAELDRIEAEVHGGRTDLRDLGFWRLVGRIKRDPELTHALADQVGRIDTAAFRTGVRLRVPVWVGNLLLLGAVLVGASAVVVARVAADAGERDLLVGAALVVAAGALAIGVHAPTHWVVGRLVGIRFTDYFLGGPPPKRPGVKTDYATYLRTPPMQRAWMHASGAIATKVAPFVVLALAPWGDAPVWSLLLLGAIGIGQIVTDVLFSVKTSDWKKYFRERAIARGAS